MGMSIFVPLYICLGGNARDLLEWTGKKRTGFLGIWTEKTIYIFCYFLPKINGIFWNGLKKMKAKITRLCEIMIKGFLRKKVDSKLFF